MFCVVDTGLGVAVFFFQAEDGIRFLVRSRGLGDVYKRPVCLRVSSCVFVCLRVSSCVFVCLRVSSCCCV